MKRLLSLLPTLAAVLVAGGIAWAANNYRQNTAGGTVTTFKTTDTAGVHVPHVNVDSAISIDTTGLATSAKQDTGNTSLGTIATNTTGAATAAKQDTGNTSLGTIATNSGTLPVGVTPTDRTLTSAAGSSEQIMAANAARRTLTIVNTGNANCGVNPTGGTAAIGGAGTITLVPFGSYTPRRPTVSAVTVICTAGQPIYADES